MYWLNLEELSMTMASQLHLVNIRLKKIDSFNEFFRSSTRDATTFHESTL